MDDAHSLHIDLYLRRSFKQTPKAAPCLLCRIFDRSALTAKSWSNI